MVFSRVATSSSTLPVTAYEASSCWHRCVMMLAKSLPVGLRRMLSLMAPAR